MVSTARYLFDREPERVVCTLARDPVFKTDTLASGILDFGQGKTANFSVSTQMFPHQRVFAIGSAGSLSLELPFNMYPDVPAFVTVTLGIGQRRVETESANQYLLEFEAFARAVLHKAPGPIPVGDAVANMAVLDALYKSAESGAWGAGEPLGRRMAG
jgi:predicted dehydrogenase